jgi:Patatin-like phospholipase
MLGRLHMSIDECRKAYRELSDEAFSQKNNRAKPSWTWPWKWKLKARFDSDALERGIKRIIVAALQQRPENQSLSHEELESFLLKEENPKCKVYEQSLPSHRPLLTASRFVTATSAAMPDRTTILANYASDRWPEDLLNSTEIWQAARATSAASTFFKPIRIGPDEELFLDGATGANNPVYCVWTEARDVWKSNGSLEENLQCLVSIGTGIPTVKSFGRSLAAIGMTLKDQATETEKTADNFLRQYTELHTDYRYFRFNVLSGLETIGLEDSAKKSQITTATRRYLAAEENKKQLESCAMSLQSRECKIDVSLNG